MTEELDRRDWMRLVAVLSVAATAAAQAPAPAAQQGQRSNVPQRVSRENLHHALKLIGLEFTEEQETMMLPGLNRALNGYEELRKIEVPLDTEPATRFFPTKPQVKTAKFTPTQERPKTFSSIEDLAFEPVTTLAALIKSRKVSSIDLTKMYLERLKKYSPNFLSLITLPQKLALHQPPNPHDTI